MFTQTAVEFDEVAARPLVVTVVSRQRQMFDNYPALEREDLVSHVMNCARREWPKYDPGRSAPSTWLTRLAHRRLIDLRRNLNRRRDRERDYARSRESAVRSAGCSLRHEADAEDLADWLGNVYRMARRSATTYLQTPQRDRSAAPFRSVAMVRRMREQRALSQEEQAEAFDKAQKAALLALSVRLEMDADGLADLLAERPDLARAMAMDQPPSAASIAVAAEHFPSFKVRKPATGPAPKADFSSSAPLLALDLTPGEADILLLLAQRKSNRAVAGAIGVEQAEAKRRVRALLFKLDVLDRYAASLKALELLRPSAAENNQTPT